MNTTAPIHRSFYLVGLVVSGALAGMILYVSLEVLSRRPDLCPIFRTALTAELAAALVLLPLLIIEDLVKVGKLTISEHTRRRISDGLYLVSITLAATGAICLYAKGENFLAAMAFAICPATLLGMVSTYTLISSFILHSTNKKCRTTEPKNDKAAI